MKFLHVLTYGIWNSVEIFKMLQRNCDKDKHHYLLFGYPETMVPEELRNHVTVLPSNRLNRRVIRTVKKQFRAADRILWHGIFLNTKLLCWLNLFRSQEKKYVWISQGTDLYDWKMSASKKNPLKWFKAKLFNHLGSKFRKRMSYFGATFPSDKVYFERSINKHGRVFDLTYLDQRWADLIEKNRSRPLSPAQDDCLKIMVGLNASPLNNHKHILNSLINLRYENIRLFIPLWGYEKRYPNYIQEVQEYANLMFGSKAVCITSMRTPQEFFDLANKVDLVINRTTFNAPHSTNIYEGVLTLLALGKPVFLSKDSPLSRYLHSQRAPIFEAEKVFSSKRQELLKQARKKMPVPDVVNTMLSECRTAHSWERLFYSLEQEYKPVEFLHIIRPSVELSSPIMEIVYENFPIDQHRFLVNRRTSILTCDKLMRFKNVNLFLVGKTRFQRLRYFYRQMKLAQHIVWHGFYVGYGNPILRLSELVMVSLFPRFLDKMTWVGWGADLYGWKADVPKSRPLKALFTKLCNHFSEKARQRIPNFVSVFPPDAKTFQAQFGHKARVFDGTYSNLRFEEILEASRPKKPKAPTRPLNIMVGHSANTWNYHIPLLNSLAKYRYENIHIHIPLSTGGTPEYVASVQAHAKNLFGEKATCITEKVPLGEYLAFLWTMDIAAFKLDRQAAIGNLMNLFYMGKKVFLPANTIMYDFFRSQEIPVCDVNQIGTLSFAELAQPCSSDTVPTYIYERTNREEIVKKWNHIFSAIRNEHAPQTSSTVKAPQAPVSSQTSQAPVPVAQSKMIQGYDYTTLPKGRANPNTSKKKLKQRQKAYSAYKSSVSQSQQKTVHSGMNKNR